MALNLSEFNQEFNPHTSVEFHLWPIQSWLNDPDITEICINQPFEVFVNKNGHWEQHQVDSLDFHHLESLSIAVARHTNKTISDTLSFSEDSFTVTLHKTPLVQLTSDHLNFSSALH